MFTAVRVFNFSMRMCAIKYKMAEGFLKTKIFRNAHRHESLAVVI